MAMHEKRSLREELEERRDELVELAGEIRVKIHLAGMEAKDTWADLKPRVEDYARRVEGITESAAADLKRAGAELKTRLQSLRDRLI
jgi:hypothetical protein